jgi:hypothetical protein
LSTVSIADLKSVERLIASMSPEKQAELGKMPQVVAQLKKKWIPNPGPQTEASLCQADELFFGGEAGGGKSDILQGLALTEHENSLLLRRTNKEASKFIKRFSEMVGSRDGWNGQISTFTLPGRIVEFGGCQLEDDKEKYKGDPHDLICVARGTPVLLANGTYLPIEELRVDMMLATLAGPRRLERIYPVQQKKCVEVTARSSDGGLLGHQVQSETHALLCESGQPLKAGDRGAAYAAKECQSGGRTSRWLRAIYEWLSTFPLKSVRCLRHMDEWLPLLWGHHACLALPVCGQISIEENGFAGFGGDSVEILPPHGLSGLQGLLSPFLRSSGLFARLPFFWRGGVGGPASSLFEGSEDRYLDGSRPYGGHTPSIAGWKTFSDGDQGCLLLSTDAEQPNPNCLIGVGTQAETHKYTRHIRRYAHPYTKDICQVGIDRDFVSASLDVVPVGVRDVFDIQVEEVRHYITKGGFVNKNCFDEIADFTETQYRFIIGWNRSSKKGQRCRVIAAGNPPTRPEGLWVAKYWAAWLDPLHPNPAQPGELRWYTTIDGKDKEVDGRGPHDIGEGKPVLARSRTFIRSHLEDNPDLEETGYDAVRAALPEKLRLAYRDGRFDAALDDDNNQVIPTSWIVAAQERWTPDGNKDAEMTAMGLDPAGGGEDAAVLSPRYGGWYAPLLEIKGADTADGSAMAGLVVRHRKAGCPIVVDIGGGYAGAVIERFKDNGIDYHRYDGRSSSSGSASGTGLRFSNKRAEAHWRFREALDPDQEGGSIICLPPDPELRADLAAVHYELGNRGIQLEEKAKIKARIGRSPNKGDAAIMAFSEGEKASRRRHNSIRRRPKVILGYQNSKRRR